MKKFVMLLACGALVAGCGDEAREMKKSVDAMQQLTQNAGKMSEAAEEGEKIYQERVATGDTVAMPYKELQNHLPGSIGGYASESGPTGSQSNMPGMQLSIAEQIWKNESNPGAEIKVSICDYGGSLNAYQIQAMHLLTLNTEDDHQRLQSLEMDIPNTSGSAIFNKDTKESKVIVGTRFRYIISLEANGAGDDQTKMLSEIAAGIARKFEGK